MNDLDHGRLLAAWHSNALLVGSLPFVAVLWGTWVGLRLTGRRLRLPPRLLAVVAATYALLACAFAVYRNTPWGAWSRPD